MTTKVSISKCVLRKCFCKLCGEDGWHVVYCNILLNLLYAIWSHLQQKMPDITYSTGTHKTSFTRVDVYVIFKNTLKFDSVIK